MVDTDFHTVNRSREGAVRMRAALIAAAAAIAAWEGTPDWPVVVPAQPLECVDSIALKPSASILRIQGLAPCSGGRFLVSDKLDYRVKMLDDCGRILKKIGGRGAGPGRFRGPGPIDRGAGLIAVAEFAGAEVQVFSDSLRCLSRFRIDGAVSDLCIDPSGHIWITAISPAGTGALIKSDRVGRAIAQFPLRNGRGDRIFDVCLISSTHSGRIMVTYMVRNLIEVWDTSGTWLSTRHIQGLPGEAPVLRYGDETGTSLLSDGVLFWSATCDFRGHLLLLGGDLSPHPCRDLYVMETDGSSRLLHVLPRASTLIRIDHRGILWAVGRDRRSVFRYKVPLDQHLEVADE